MLPSSKTSSLSVNKLPTDIMSAEKLFSKVISKAVSTTRFCKTKNKESIHYNFILYLAEKFLTFAFERCHKNCRTNKRLILIYLIPVKMLLVRLWLVRMPKVQHNVLSFIYRDIFLHPNCWESMTSFSLVKWYKLWRRVISGDSTMPLFNTTHSLFAAVFIWFLKS